MIELDPALFLLHGNAGVVPDLLSQAREGVEKSCLSGIWVADDCNAAESQLFRSYCTHLFLFPHKHRFGSPFGAIRMNSTRAPFVMPNWSRRWRTCGAVLLRR
jgi:hypothetical protein